MAGNIEPRPLKVEPGAVREAFWLGLELNITVGAKPVHGQYTAWTRLVQGVGTACTRRGHGLSTAWTRIVHGLSTAGEWGGWGGFLGNWAESDRLGVLRYGTIVL